MAKDGKRFLVDTSPTKEVVVDGITRDASDHECIFDLIDNSIDAARNITFGNISPKLRNELPEGYAGYEIKLYLSGASFKITDNCGGIAVANLKDSVLRFGERSDQDMGIGTFGVGLNRAIFRLGDSVHIVTDTGRERAEISLAKDKYLESSSWNVPAQQLESTGRAGTTIEIKHLQATSSKNFGDERWVNALKREVARRYGRFIKKKLAIWIDHDPLQNEEVQLREGGPIPIREKYIREDDVTIQIVYGEHRLHKFPGEPGHSEEQNRRLTAQYGWTILCNDRAVVMSDKTHHTGWDVQKFHSDFYGFVGYVNFVSQNPRKLPWTTTKTDVDLNSPAYQAALLHMRKITQQWRSEASQRKKTKRAPQSPPPKKATPSSRRPARTKSGSPKPERPVTKPSHNQYRTVLPRDINEKHCFDKHHAVVEEAKRLDIWDFPYAGLALIRSLFEISSVKFLVRHNRYEDFQKWFIARRRNDGATIPASREDDQMPTMEEILAFFHNHPNLWGVPTKNHIKHSVSKTANHVKLMNSALHNAYQQIAAPKAVEIRDEVHPLLRHLIEQ